MGRTNGHLPSYAETKKNDVAKASLFMGDLEKATNVREMADFSRDGYIKFNDTLL